MDGYFIFSSTGHIIAQIPFFSNLLEKSFFLSPIAALIFLIICFYNHNLNIISINKIDAQTLITYNGKNMRSTCCTKHRFLLHTEIVIAEALKERSNSMTPTETYYENLAKVTMKSLERRQFECHYCKTAQDAVTLASQLVPAGSTVSFGGSMTFSESGMADTLNQRSDITLLDRSKAGSPEEIKEIYHKSLNADYYFMSSNAITADGELVNIDGTGNRLAALIYGPEHVIILAGMNKVCPTLEEAVSRVKNVASPLNANRLNRSTPCAATGLCSDCLSPDCICSHTVITRRSAPAKRIKVILIGEALGY